MLALRGSWRAQTRAAETQPTPARPRPPDWLSDDAKAVFESVARRLHAIRLVARVDEGALARYADLLVAYRRASEFVAKHGDVYVVRGRPGPNGEEGKPVGFKLYPQAKRMVALASELLRLEREFGLTPSARARLATEVPAPADPAADYFAPPTTGTG
jgi:P27 family predicted phage terminase small subunit